MTSPLLRAAAALFAASALTAALRSEEPGRFLTPSELADLGEKSKVLFATELIETPADLPNVRHPGWPPEGKNLSLPHPAILTDGDGSRFLTTFRCSPGATTALEKAEGPFQQKSYDTARAIYEAALGEDPDCYLLALAAGDCHLLSGDPARALSFYDRAIASNPADFHGHWFRASALSDMRLGQEALAAYSRALAMAPGYPKLLSAIRSRADSLGVDVRDGWFQPAATARLEGPGVTIYTLNKPHWWVYGLCKGIWLGEESHRVRITGKAQHNWTTSEEMECLGALLTQYESSRDAGKAEPEPQLDTLLDVVQQGLLWEFVAYEFGSRFSPHLVILQPDPAQARIAEHVRRYVLPDRGTKRPDGHPVDAAPPTTKDGM